MIFYLSFSSNFILYFIKDYLKKPEMKRLGQKRTHSKFMMPSEHSPDMVIRKANMRGNPQ